jgi:hypothetical protein
MRGNSNASGTGPGNPPPTEVLASSSYSNRAGRLFDVPEASWTWWMWVDVADAASLAESKGGVVVLKRCRALPSSALGDSRDSQRGSVLWS